MLHAYGRGRGAADTIIWSAVFLPVFFFSEKHQFLQQLAHNTGGR